VTVLAVFVALAVRKSVQEPVQVPATYIILAAPSASVMAEGESAKTPNRSVKYPPVVEEVPPTAVEEVPNVTVCPAPTALPLKSFKVAIIVVVPFSATDVGVMFIATAAGRPATKLTRTDAGTPPV
jgi:hypothetical protein